MTIESRTSDPKDVQSASFTDAVSAPSPAGVGVVKARGRALAASLVLVIAFAFLMNRGGLPLLPPKGALQHVDTTYFAGFAVLLLAQTLARFGRYHYLIAPIAHLSLRRLMTINAISLALITFLPLRIGEVARPAMLREKGHLSAWAVTGTVGAERVLDGIVFSISLLVGLSLATPHEPLPTHIGALPVPASLVPRVARLACVVFFAAFSIMAGFYWFRSVARRLTEQLVGKVSQPLGRAVADVVERLSDGLKFLLNPRYTVPYLAITISGVMLHVWAIQLLARAVGIPELTFTQSMVVVGVLALGFGMPNAPGFFGTVQIALYAGLAVYIAPEKVVHEGAVLVFLFYVTYLAEVVGLAALALLVEAALPSAVPDEASR